MVEILRKKGFVLNENDKVVNSIFKMVEKCGGYCPCRQKESNKTEDMKCPCKNYRENEKCCCGLYLKIEK